MPKNLLLWTRVVSTRENRYITCNIQRFNVIFCLFLCVDSLRSSQQFFSHFGTGLPGLNQYKAEDKVSCPRRQHSALGEARNRNPSISSQALYH